MNSGRLSSSIVAGISTSAMSPFKQRKRLKSQSNETLHCNKKWAKRSFPLENIYPEEGKFPCGYWNIFPVTHTVFIYSSVREKCSRLWAGTFYWSKKVNFLQLSFHTDISRKFQHSVFLKNISGKFPHSRGKNVLGALPSLAHSWKAYPIKQKTQPF